MLQIKLTEHPKLTEELRIIIYHSTHKFEIYIYERYDNRLSNVNNMKNIYILISLLLKATILLLTTKTEKKK